MATITPALREAFKYMNLSDAELTRIAERYEGKTHTVAREQIGEHGQIYWNTRGPMTLEEATECKQKHHAMNPSWRVMPIRMEGTLVVVVVVVE